MAASPPPKGESEDRFLSAGISVTIGGTEGSRYGEDREARPRATVARHRVSISPSDGCLHAGTHLIGGGGRTLG